VPPKIKDGPMRVSVTKDNDKVFGNVDAFDEAACDSGWLDHVVSSHQCMNSIHTVTTAKYQILRVTTGLLTLSNNQCV